MILMLVLVFFCDWTTPVSVRSERIHLASESLLLYFDELTKSDSETLLYECEQKSYAYTVYYRTLYFRFCGLANSTSPSKNFSNFCDNLEIYYSKSAQSHAVDDVEQSIKNVARQHEIFGDGLEHDELWEAHLTCRSIRNYYREKQLLYGNESARFHQLEWIQQPNYTEWFLHAIPFCPPISCGFTKNAFFNKNPHPAAFDCMPRSHRAVLYILFCIDALIVAATVLANVVIVIVVPKTNVARTPHG